MSLSGKDASKRRTEMAKKSAIREVNQAAIDWAREVCGMKKGQRWKRSNDEIAAMMHDRFQGAVECSRRSDAALMKLRGQDRLLVSGSWAYTADFNQQGAEELERILQARMANYQG